MQMIKSQRLNRINYFKNYIKYLTIINNSIATFNKTILNQIFLGKFYFF